MLDQDGAAATLTIQGELIFDDSADRILTVDQIIIEGDGKLTIGADLPNGFTNQAKIVINHAPTSAEAFDRGILVTDNGTLDLKGLSKGASWTRLTTTAVPLPPPTPPSGPSELPFIYVEDPPAWKLGDRIVIASSDFDMDLAEVATVKNVTGNKVELGSLVRQHFAGDIGQFPNHVPCFTEVGLLSRTIRIEGDSDKDFRGHVRIEPSGVAGEQPTVRIEWTEFANLGNLGLMGQYPLHFHQLGDMSGSYVRSSSIHDSNNRGIVIHNTSGLEITHNVVSDTISFAYYMEEDPGSTPITGTMLMDNLGLLTRANTSSPLIDEDKQPGTFYLRNWDNNFSDNAAAGSDAYGFYVAMPSGMINPGAGEALNFSGSTTHSNGRSGWYHNDRPNVNWVDHDTPYVESLVAWKNRDYGVWLRAYGIPVIRDIRVADNLAGLYLSSAGTPNSIPFQSAQVVHDVVIIGESEENDASEPVANLTALELAHGRSLPQDNTWNVPCPTTPRLKPLTAFTVYDGLQAIGCGDGDPDCIFIDRFRDFDYISTNPNYYRRATAFTQIMTESPWSVDPRNFARGIFLEDPFQLQMNTPTPEIGVERAVLMRKVWPEEAGVSVLCTNPMSGTADYTAFPTNNGISHTAMLDIDGELVDWIDDTYGLPPNIVPGEPTYHLKDDAFLRAAPGVIVQPVEYAEVVPPGTTPVNSYLWQPLGEKECMVTLEVINHSPVAPCMAGTPGSPTHLDFLRRDFTLPLTHAPVATFRAWDTDSTPDHTFYANAILSNDIQRNVLMLAWDREIGRPTTTCCADTQGDGCDIEMELPSQLEVNLRYGRVGSQAMFALPLAAEPTSVQDCYDADITQVFSYNALINPAGSPGNRWYWHAEPGFPIPSSIAPQPGLAGWLLGRIVVSDANKVDFSQVVNDTAMASFYDGATETFCIDYAP